MSGHRGMVARQRPVRVLVETLLTKSREPYADMGRQMARRRRALVSIAAAGAVAAVVRGRRARPAPEDLEESEPLGSLHGRPVTVALADGSSLRAEVHGPEDAAITLVLAHGYVLSDRCWHYQVRDLRAARPELRVVTYDQRGHGRSGPTAREGATLQQLGDDLRAVLDAVVPRGPVVLAGHSMGGMTVMALAEQQPQLFGPRIVAVGLVSTSPGRLATITYGLPRLFGPVVQRVVPWLNERNKAAEAAGRTAKGGGSARVLFGPHPSPAQVRFVLTVMAGTSAATVADFHYTFIDHDRLQALVALRKVPVTVLVGDRDVLCPVAHSREIAEALPESRLTVFPGAGHMLPLERHQDVSAALLDLVGQGAPRKDDLLQVQA